MNDEYEPLDKANDMCNDCLNEHGLDATPEVSINSGYEENCIECKSNFFKPFIEI